MVTLTNRRVYVILFFARPLGVFFFSCGSTYLSRVSSISYIDARHSGVDRLMVQMHRGDSQGLCALLLVDRTFGVCDLTFPARARDPWTFPMIAV